MSREFADEIKDYVSKNISCIEVAKVTEINFKNNTLSVELFSRDKIIRGSVPIESDPINIEGVPFIVMNGGKAGMSFPISVGDECVVMFSDTNFIKWLNLGSGYIDMQEERHERTSAFALVGVSSISNAFTWISENAIMIKNGENTEIEMTEDDIFIRNTEDVEINLSETDMTMKNTDNVEVNLAKTEITMKNGDVSKILQETDSITVEVAPNKIVVNSTDISLITPNFSVKVTDAGINMLNVNTGVSLVDGITDLSNALYNSVDVKGYYFNGTTKSAISSALTKIKGVLS